MLPEREAFGKGETATFRNRTGIKAQQNTD